MGKYFQLKRNQLEISYKNKGNTKYIKLIIKDEFLKFYGDELIKMGEEPDDILTIEKSEGRRKCPSCAEENKVMIHETTDKKNIILDYPRVYGKKFKCGSCGTEWREK